jgi:hypothetical protein
MSTGPRFLSLPALDFAEPTARSGVCERGTLTVIGTGFSPNTCVIVQLSE